MIKRLLKKSFLFFLFFVSYEAKAQCPQFFDGTGTLSSNPYWVSCSGGSFTLNLASSTSFGSYTVNWGDGTPNDVGASYTANSFIVHNYAAIIDSFIVTITTTGPNCTINGVVVMEKPVNASIQIPLGGVTSICAPGNMSFINSSTDVSPTTIFTWNFGDGSPILTFGPANAGTTIVHTFASGTVSCQTAVTLTAQNHCSFGTPTTAQFNPIEVYDKDQVSVSPDATIKCMPSTSFTFTNTTTRNCVPQGNVTQRYEMWNFHDYWGQGHDSTTGWIPWPPSLPRIINYPGVGAYSVTLTDSSLCGIDSATTTVIILNAPVAGVAAPVDTACPGTTLTFNNLSSTGYTYKWNFGDNGTYTSFPFGNVTHTYNTPGNYTVSVAAIIGAGNASCRDTARVPVFILTPPTSAFTRTPGVGCNNLTVTYTDNSIGAVSWVWKKNGTTFSTAQNPPNQSYTTGTYTITLTVTGANGCTNTSQQLVNVFQNPVAAFTNPTACQNSVTQFSDASTFSVGDPIVTWLWDFGDGSPTSSFQSPSHTYTTATTVTVTLNVSTANCSGSTSVPVTINLKPTATISAAPLSGCGPLTVNFGNTSTGATIYNWDFGNATTSTATTPACVYTNSLTTTATFTAQLIASTAAGCSDTATKTISVSGKPLAAFTSNAVAQCSPFTVNFTNTSVGATTYSWDFGDASALSTAANPNHIFNNITLFLQNYTVSLIATNANGCKDTATQVDQAYPQTLPNFVMVPDSGCTPLSVNFPPVAGAVTYQWDFGDGNTSTSTNPTHLYNSNSTTTTVYTVQLIATNAFNCIDTTVASLNVFGKPIANFSESTNLGCPSLNVAFTNTSTVFSSSSWDFGDGSALSTTTSPSHIYANASTTTQAIFNATLIVKNAKGCSDTLTKIITVQPDVHAAFIADTPICAPVNVVFTNNSLGANSYNWNFGDGNSSSLTAPSHLFANGGTSILTYTTTLIATNTTTGCDDTATTAFNIYPTPVASFTDNPTSQLYPAATVTMNNTTANIGLWNYTWTFGDANGSNLQQPLSHTYATWGNYTITLIAASAFCSDTVTHTITIIPPVPIANFLGSFKGCRPLTVSFTNTTLYGTSYNWSFGDGGISSQTNPTYTYYNAGTYTVSLTATGPGGINSIVGIDSVTVYPKPAASFVATPTLVYIPTTVLTTINLTTNGSTYLWDFGDGATSTLFSPTHSYATEGNYQITLYATSSFGCKDTFLLPTLIKAEVQSDVAVPNAFSPNPNGPSGDGTYDPAATNNDIFHPIIVGAKKYELRIFNRWGELMFRTEDVNKGWDGYYKGKLCTQDVYIWKIVAETNDDKKINKAGDVLLIR